MASLPRPSPVIGSPQMSHQPQHYVESLKSYAGATSMPFPQARSPYEHQSVSYQASSSSVMRPLSTSSTYKSFTQQPSTTTTTFGGSGPKLTTSSVGASSAYPTTASSLLSQGGHQGVTYQSHPSFATSYHSQSATAQLSPSSLYKPPQQPQQQTQQHRSLVYSTQQAHPAHTASHSPFVGAEHTYMERTTMVPHTSSQMSVAGGLAYGNTSTNLTPQQPERFSAAGTSSYVTYTSAAAASDQHEAQHTYIDRAGQTVNATTFPSFAAGRQESVMTGEVPNRVYAARTAHAVQSATSSSQVTPMGALRPAQAYAHEPVVETSTTYDAVRVEESENLGARHVSGTNYVANQTTDFLRQPQTPTHPTGDFTQTSMPPSDVSKLPAECFTPIAVGEKLPTAHIDLHGVCVNLQEFFEDRCGILFGLVGAFYPLDTKKAVPELLRCMDSFEKQVDFVGCLVVNDPFVVKAWAKRLGMTDQFTFVADADAKFTKALGMAQYLPEKGLGLRSRRFALVVGPRSKIQWVGFDEEAFASSVLQVVPRFVRTPWKSFIVGISYDKKKTGDTDAQVGNSVTEAIASIRLQLTHQGFCSEADWQLVLSDNIPDIFKPTRENIMSGLKWLVEGTQAGDVLCLYFAGRGHRTVNPDGTETRGILPMDWETAGIITESDLYDILAANVPEYCRMTIILDIEGEESVQCPLPYCAPCLQATEGETGVQLLPISAPNEAWVNKFQVEERPKGEVLTISLEGPGRVPAGCLANLMNTTVSTELRDPVSEESDQPQIVEIPISFRDKMDRMTTQLQEWGLQKYVMFGSSFPLDLKEDFSLADILPQAPPQGN